MLWDKFTNRNMRIVIQLSGFQKNIAYRALLRFDKTFMI